MSQNNSYQPKIVKLLIAVQNNNIDAVKGILSNTKKCIAVEMDLHSTYDPIMLACGLGRTEILRLLLGSLVSNNCHFGDMQLERAIVQTMEYADSIRKNNNNNKQFGERFEPLITLLEHPAVLSFPRPIYNHKYLDVLSYLIRNNLTNTIKETVNKYKFLFNSHNVQQKPLMIATKYNNTDLIKFFIENGADPNFKNYTGITPLMFAAQNKDVKPETIHALIENGADVNETYNGRTTIMLAIESNNISTIRALLSRSINGNNTKNNRKNNRKLVDLNIKDEDGTTAFGYALYKNASILNLLLNAGANINAPCFKNNITPLMYASYVNPNPNLLKYLLDKGALPVPEQGNRDSHTPLYHVLVKIKDFKKSRKEQRPWYSLSKQPMSQQEQQYREIAQMLIDATQNKGSITNAFKNSGMKNDFPRKTKENNVNENKVKENRVNKVNRVNRVNRVNNN